MSPPPRAALALAIALAAVCPATAGDAPWRGRLLIIGGGERPPDLLARFVELAGGREARVVVIATASSVPEEVGPELVAEIEAAGAGRAIFPTVTAETASAPATVAALEGATGVFFSGGDQSRVTRALLGTPLLEAIRRVYSGGGVIAGTSAGAAIMGPVMITGDERREVAEDEESFATIVADNVVTTAGLGFLAGTVVDQHFVARKRFNRLISVILEHPALLGIGVDESTAILVGGDRTFEVLGRNQVLVLDASRARDVSVGPEGRLAGHGIRLDVLRAGERFDLAARRPVP